MPEFGNLCRSIVSNYKQWKMFEKFENPYEEMHRAFDASSKVDLSKSTVVLMRYLFNKLNIWGNKLLFQYYSNILNIEAEMGQILIALNITLIFLNNCCNRPKIKSKDTYIHL